MWHDLSGMAISMGHSLPTVLSSKNLHCFPSYMSTESSYHAQYHQNYLGTNPAINNMHGPWNGQGIQATTTHQPQLAWDGAQLAQPVHTSSQIVSVEQQHVVVPQPKREERSMRLSIHLIASILLNLVTTIMGGVVQSTIELLFPVWGVIAGVSGFYTAGLVLGLILECQSPPGYTGTRRGIHIAITSINGFLMICILALAFEVNFVEPDLYLNVTLVVIWFFPALYAAVVGFGIWVCIVLHRLSKKQNLEMSPLLVSVH